MGTGSKMVKKIQERWTEFNKEQEEFWRGAVVQQLTRVTIPKLAKLVRKHLDDSFESAINAYYQAYTPRSYSRRGSLYKVLNITDDKLDDLGIPYVDVDDISASLGEFIDEDGNPFTLPDKYQKEPPYSVFLDIMFEGYHGGASSIDASKSEKYGEHPNPGIPYWRFGEYKFGSPELKEYGSRWVDGLQWWDPAFQSDAPFKLFTENFEDWVKFHLKEEVQKEVLAAFAQVNKVFLPYYKSCFRKEFFG